MSRRNRITVTSYHRDYNQGKPHTKTFRKKEESDLADLQRRESKLAELKFGFSLVKKQSVEEENHSKKILDCREQQQIKVEKRTFSPSMSKCVD